MSKKPIKQLANGKYQVRKSKRIRGQLKTLKCTTCQTKGAAMAKLREFEKELEDLADKYKNGVTLWSDALGDFEEYSKSQHTYSTSYTQVKTLKEYTSDWDFSPVSDLSKNAIRVHIEEKMESRSVSTKNNLAKYIRNVFRLQVDKGKLQQNPAQGIRFQNKGMKLNKLKAMSVDEIKKLFKFTKEMGHEWYPVYRVVYGLGLRSGEAYALRWSNIDLKLRRATISEAYCKKSKMFGPPKNKETRIVPISRNLCDYFRELRAESPDNEFVLPRIKSWAHGDAAKILAIIQDDLGIDRSNFHSLRASFITHLLNAGITITIVQKMVGHKDLKTTMRYVRLSGSDLDGGTDPIDL